MELTFRRPLRDNGVQRFAAERVDDDVSVEINLLPLYTERTRVDYLALIYLNHRAQHNHY